MNRFKFLGSLMCVSVFCAGVFKISLGQTASPQDYQAVRQQILDLQNRRKIGEAILIAEQQRDRLERDGTKSNPSLRDCLGILGELYRTAGDYKKAEEALRPSLAMSLRDFGDSDVKSAKAFHELALVLQTMGKSEDAEKLELQALEICQRKPCGDEGNAALKNNLATICSQRGRMADALSYAQEARSAAVLAFSESHEKTANCYLVEGRVLAKWGKIKPAEECFNQALSIGKHLAPPNDSIIASANVELSGLYFNQSLFAESEQFLTKADAIAKQQGAQRSDLLANIAFRRGLIDTARAQYTSALTALDQAKNIRSRDPTQKQKLGEVLELEAAVFDRLGQYAKAESAYKSAIEVYEVYGPESPIPATALTSLGLMYQRLGDYKRARPRLEKAYALCRHAFKSDNVNTASAATSLGSLEVAEKNFAKADELFTNALDVLSRLGFQQHVHYASTLASLSLSQRLQRKFDAALDNAIRALDLYEGLVGSDHPNYGACWRDAALALHAMGKYEEAESAYRTALSIFKKALGGEDHFFTSEILSSLAALEIDLNHRDAAIDLTSRAARANESILNEVLSFAPEAQRFAYMRSRPSPYTLFAALDLPKELATAVLREKMIISDSIQEERGLVSVAGSDTGAKEKLAQRAAIQGRLYALQLGVPENKPQARNANVEDEVAKLQAKLDQTESDLARIYAKLGATRRALRITVEQVQASIDPNEVLIEYFRFPLYAGRGRWQSAYGAVVLSREGEAQWRLLGANEKGEIVEGATAIEKRIQAVTLELRKSPPDLPDESVVVEQLSALHRILWQPLEKFVPAGASVIISPDGALNSVSFAALLEKSHASDSGRFAFLAERNQISYVSTGRDLVTDRVGVEASPSRPALLVLAPQYSKEPGPRPAAGPFPYFDPLPDASDLASDLRRIIGAKVQCAPPLVGVDATESKIVKTIAPFILHFYTHGFFIAPPSKAAPSGAALETASESQLGITRALDDPMRRSGLALAGANDAFRTWGARLTGDVAEPLPPAGDGILTAEEAAEMDLRGTWLVTLAACDTGVGDIVVGEGVMGIRRAFSLTGAQNVMLTLWPIGQSYSKEFARKFYARALETNDPPGALAWVQRQELTNLAKDEIAAAVRAAAPFVISFRRPARQRSQ